jgi:hypothetical protein
MYKATLKFVGAAGELRSGQGNNGPWYVQPMLFETVESNASYQPKKIVVDAWNDNINLFGQAGASGSAFEVTAYPESREYNGKWYTSLRMTSAKASAVSTGVPSAPPAAPMAAPAPEMTQSPSQPAATQEADDLPF